MGFPASPTEPFQPVGAGGPGPGGPGMGRPGKNGIISIYELIP